MALEELLHLPIQIIHNSDHDLPRHQSFEHIRGIVCDVRLPKIVRFVALVERVHLSCAELRIDRRPLLSVM